MDAEQQMAPFRRSVILVAEDDVDTLRILRISLMRAGYTVVTATDGRAALEKIRERRPDAVILDWVMPEMPGVEVLRRIKQDERTRSIPVIMLTIKSEYDDMRESFNVGADYYIPKPFKMTQVFTGLKLILGR